MDSIDRGKLSRDIKKYHMSDGMWINPDEQMPEEHESMFAKFYDTDMRHGAMFHMTSKTVLATIEYDEGTRIVIPLSTKDGNWNSTQIPIYGKFVKVVAWMPMPEPYRG